MKHEDTDDDARRQSSSTSTTTILLLLLYPVRSLILLQISFEEHQRDTNWKRQRRRGKEESTTTTTAATTNARELLPVQSSWHERVRRSRECRGVRSNFRNDETASRAFSFVRRVWPWICRIRCVALERFDVRGRRGNVAEAFLVHA